MELTVNNIYFKAKLGKNVLKQVTKEFNYDTKRVRKYTILFDEAFSLNLDGETVVELNKGNHFVFSNRHFPNVKYQHTSKIHRQDDIARALINECHKLFSNAENDLFRIVIAKLKNSGTDSDAIKQKIEQLLTCKRSKEAFLENLKIADRIKTENPESRLLLHEFDDMLNVIMQENAKIPSTKIYDAIHNFEDLVIVSNKN